MHAVAFKCDSIAVRYGECGADVVLIAIQLDRTPGLEGRVGAQSTKGCLGT